MCPIPCQCKYQNFSGCRGHFSCNYGHIYIHIYLALPPRGPATPATGPTTRLPTYSLKVPPITPWRFSTLPNHRPNLAARSDPSSIFFHFLIFFAYAKLAMKCRWFWWPRWVRSNAFATRSLEDARFETFLKRPCGPQNWNSILLMSRTEWFWSSDSGLWITIYIYIALIIRFCQASYPEFIKSDFFNLTFNFFTTLSTARRRWFGHAGCHCHSAATMADAGAATGDRWHWWPGDWGPPVIPGRARATPDFRMVGWLRRSWESVRWHWPMAAGKKFIGSNRDAVTMEHWPVLVLSLKRLIIQFRSI